MRQNAGDPKAVQDALDAVDEFLGLSAATGPRVALNDAGREDAWAEMGG